MDKAIIVDHLSYSNVLKDVSFTIQSGEMVGILGSTNSGKSLILKILAGLIKPTSGFVSMLGYDPFLKSAEYLKQISFITKDKKQLLPDLLPIKSIEITKDMYGVTNREFSKNLSELTQYIKDPALIENLIFKPKILLLDEAILDHESVYQYNIKNNSTTLLTADKIDKLNTLVRRVILIDQGHVVYDGAIDEIITKFAKDKVINATLSSPIDIKIVGEIGLVKKYAYPHLRLACPREVVALAAAEVMQNFPVIDLNIQEMSTDEIISNMKLQ